MGSFDTFEVTTSQISITQVAPLRFAFRSVAPEKIALVRFAPLRFAAFMLAHERFACLRALSRRSAVESIGLTLGYLFRQWFQLCVPCLRMARCSGLATSETQ